MTMDAKAAVDDLLLLARRTGATHAEVVPASAQTQDGLFDVHRVGDRLLFEIPDGLPSDRAALAEPLDRSAIRYVCAKGTDPEVDSYSGFFDNGHRKTTDLHDYLPFDTPGDMERLMDLWRPRLLVFVKFDCWPNQVLAADRAGVPVLLLDTDIPQNDPADRPITGILYVRGREMRLCQELVLGVGGWIQHAVRVVTKTGPHGKDY